MRSMIFLTGVILLIPFCFFGLGLIGYGADTLTELTNNVIISKLLMGVLSVATFLCLGFGYVDLRDGIVPEFEKE